MQESDLHPSLKPFQRSITGWAVRRGVAAVWADTGLGKTRMQLEWARLSADTSLVVAPLAVCAQTVEEAASIGISAAYVRDGEDVAGPGVWVTNYEMVERFPASLFGAVVLDESSILKQSTGKTRNMLIRHFENVPRKLSCTATPGPNDPEELTNQAEFLGIMTRTNMLAAYFVHDQDGWRLKGHAADPMIAWMNGWAFAIRKPSDIGDSDDGYNLPGLNVIPEIVETEIEPAEGELFAATMGGVSGRSKVRKQSLADRVDRAVELVEHEPDEPWVLWCGMNAEADALAARIPGSVNVHGSMTPDEKAQHLSDFATGANQILITKPSLASFGLNWQHCARTAFVGLSDSYEQYYQCMRRFHRFGQKRVVNAHVIVSALEQQVARNVMRKEGQANRIIDGMIHERKNK